MNDPARKVIDNLLNENRYQEEKIEKSDEFQKTEENVNNESSITQENEEFEKSYLQWKKRVFYTAGTITLILSILIAIIISYKMLKIEGRKEGVYENITEIIYLYENGFAMALLGVPLSLLFFHIGSKKVSVIISIILILIEIINILLVFVYSRYYERLLYLFM